MIRALDIIATIAVAEDITDVAITVISAATIWSCTTAGPYICLAIAAGGIVAHIIVVRTIAPAHTDSIGSVITHCIVPDSVIGTTHVNSVSIVGGTTVVRCIVVCDEVVVRFLAPQYDSTLHIITYACATTVLRCIVVCNVALAQHHLRPESGFRIVMQVVVADIAVLVLGVRAASIDEYPVSTCSAATTCALVVVDVIVDYRERRRTFSTLG